MKARIILAAIAIVAFTSYKTFAQIKKGDVHIGISGLPIVDVFNSYPDNKITGLGISGQIGFFPFKNLYLGLNPYYVKVKNRYPEDGMMTQEDLKIYGINTAIYYYGAVTSKFYIYAGLSAGFGVSDEKMQNSATTIKSAVAYPILTAAPGIGIHYFISERMTLNLNLPLISAKYISYSNVDNFKTIAPMIGVGFFF